MTPPTYTPPVDPNLQLQQAAAEQAKGDALQLRLKANTADIMTRYGARTALGGGQAAGVVQGGGATADPRGAPLSLSGFF
jgi:hypothetical protein